MRFLLAVAGAVFVASAAFAADDDAAKIKALIPDAAGMPAEVLQKLADDPNTTPNKLAESKGQTLLWWVFGDYAPSPENEKLTSFRFTGNDGSVNPAHLPVAFAGPKGKDGKFRATATVIHPEYITDFACKVDGTTATGTVTFKVEKVYEGKVEYTARKKDGTWRIEEFRLPDHKVTLVLGDKGKWVKK